VYPVQARESRESESLDVLRATLTVPRDITGSLIGGMEVIGHEAETALTKKTYHYKICPAPARPRARQSWIISTSAKSIGPLLI
jgi:hypothetical protein